MGAASERDAMGGSAGQIDDRVDGASPAVHLAESWRQSIAALLAVLAALLIFSASAHAFSQRGHEFDASFGERGEGELPFKPSALAVDEASGDVYVLESANNRIVRFGPEHRFIEAWGYGVENGKEEFERCSKEWKECQAGIAGFGKEGQFDAPVAIAVDNANGSPSAGDVYVVANRSPKKAVIDKFNFEGKLLDRLKTEEAEGSIDGVAVDSSGAVWVDREDGGEEFLLETYNDETKNKQLGEASTLEIPEVVKGNRPTRPGLAVDDGDVYITYEPHGLTAEEVAEEEEAIAERAKERKKDHEQPVAEQPQQPCEANRCLVAKLEIVPSESGGVESEPLIPEVDGEDSAGVAVDSSAGRQSSGDVYLNNVTSVAAFTSAGSLIQRLGGSEGHLADAGGSGLAVDASSGEVLAGDSLAGRVDVFGLEGPGAPTAESESVTAAAVTASSAKLGAKIDPSGLDTRVRFRYGTVPCTGQPSPCTEETSEEPIGAVYEDVSASAELTGLSPDTTYHFLAIATNAAGSAESEERKFTTLPANATEATLPDGRAWELVSPAEERGVAIEPIRREGGLIEASTDGRSISYLASAPAGEEEPAGNRAPEMTQLISTRTASGSWSTENITPPSEEAQGIPGDVRQAYQFFSPDLSLGLVDPLITNPTAKQTIYLRDTACTGQSCYATLATGEAGSKLEFKGATQSLRYAGVFSASPLTAGAAPDGLYEWSETEDQPGEGHFKLVSVLPDGEQASGHVGLGTIGKFEGARNAISEDGSRVVWTWAEGTGGVHLYSSKVENGQAAVETTLIDTPEAGLAPTGKPNPLFQTASVSGSRVFFTDNQPLTKDASPEGEDEATGDLYVFEPEKPAGERVTDLTPDLSGEASAIQGGVIGASEDGSYVYFVANGALAAGAQAGGCVYEGSRASACNLYVVHNNGEEWEKPRFIARLSNEDGADWGAAANNREQYELFRMTSRVSPNGRYLAFMSDRRLTEYNNTDVNSGVPDEEVYLYDVLSGRLVCASCNPSGAQPVGVHDIQESGEGRGLLVDRSEVWSPESDQFDHWLAASVPGWTPLNSNEAFYQSHYLTNEGRLFFDSPDALVEQAGNGKEDVYEYEPKGVGSCGTSQSENALEGGCVALISSGDSQQESAFLDASESGNDVFFLTSAKLSPQDPDHAFDIYDARVCSGPGAEEPCPSTAANPTLPCETEAGCKGTAPPPPTYGAPASSVLSGSGNIVQQGAVLSQKEEKAKPKPLTKAQLLAKALKACKKHEKKIRRLACEKQARKKYGSAKKTGKS
jgi:WD40-like Beta Propeller Repeat